MANSDNIDTLNNITTLEAAKQEIARLLEFQKKAYYFLGVFSNYDVREPLLLADSLAKLLQNEEVIQHYPAFLQTILENHERIDRISIAVRQAVAFEERWRNRLASFKTGHPAEEININSILNKSIQEIREAGEFKDLPPVPFNFSVLEEVLSNLIWFIKDRNTNTEIKVTTDFDNQWVKITFLCFTEDPHRHVFVLNEFMKFNDESSFIDFNPISLFLFNSWNNLKIYDGLLSYNVQDNTEKGMPSTVEITIWLKR